MNQTQGSPHFRFRATTLALACALALAGCGGGGGGGAEVIRADPPPAAPPPDPVVFDPDPAFSKHLTLTGADVAHDAGLTGEGIRIGVVDSGVNRNHPALSPRVIENLVYIDPNSNDLSVDDVVGHGTAVAQIMAGAAFGAWPGGIAPGAEIVSARIISDEPPADDGSGKGNEIDGAVGLAPIHQDLIDRNVRIMNNSWGGLYWTNPEATAPIAQEYRPFVIGHGGLVVFATGNESFADPSSMAALPSQLGPGGGKPGADLEIGWLAVAALDSDNPTQLADYSNACGVAMNYCLAAPGDVVVTGANDAPDMPGYWSWSGTSFAAPIVSGAAALVWEAFPYFNNDLVRQTLLGTATDLGAAGVDATFGYGLVDIGKAIKGPAKLDWGQVTVDFGAGLSTWSNDISGAGGITKQGGGHLDLTGQNSYAGDTVVQAGTLSSLHDLPGNARVLQNGLLLLDDISVHGDLRNEGIVSFYGGDANGALHVVDGDFVQTASGAFGFDVGSQLHVLGRADIDGEALVTGVTEGYVHSAREVFINADQGLFGRFDALSASDGVFLDATLGYDADSAWLDITRLDVSVAAQSMGMTPAAAASAVRIETAFDMIDSGRAGFSDSQSASAFIGAAGLLQRTPNAAAAEQSLASLSGELHAADAAFAMMAIEDGRHALESRLDAVDGGSAGTWASALGSKRMLWSHTRLDTTGWQLGQDVRLSERLMLGVAFGQSEGHAFHDVRSDRESNRQYEGQIYAAWNADDNYLLGRLGFGRIDRRLLREIVLGSGHFGVDAGYASRYTVVGLQAGHRFGMDSGELTPYVGMQTVQLNRDGFSEHGAAGFGLSAHGSDTRSTRAMVGARLERTWSAGPLQMALQGRLEWQRMLARSGDTITARFTGLGAWAPVSSAVARPGDEAVVFGLGLRTRLPQGSQLRLDLDTRREDGRTWTGARLSWAFGF